MVKGLEIFRDHFRQFTDRYILIGGTVCDLLLDEAGLTFRATKDLDIVLSIETLDREFSKAFWEFVTLGRYEIQESSAGEKRFYRFQKPEDDTFPFMLELFSRRPDVIQLPDGAHLTPIPTDQELASLSAILLDDALYSWIQAGKIETDGLPIVQATHLIPLKVRAYLDLAARRADGQSVQSGDIKKHRNDVFRLAQLLIPDQRLSPPPEITDDMQAFLRDLDPREVSLRQLGLGHLNFNDVVTLLKSIYRVLKP
jgi:hypothetical protein